MNILALDLATKCGFAYEIAGVRDSGMKSFEPRKGQAHGYRYALFNVWMYTVWKAHKLDLVVYEKPIPFHSSQAASELAFGFSTRVQEFCARQNIPYRVVQNNVLKKYACGKGRAEKWEMIRAAQVLKPGVTDDNESDALWLLEYARRNVNWSGK